MIKQNIGNRAGDDYNDPMPSKSSQSVLLPLLILYGLTIGAQLISLAFGRINETQSFISIILPSIVFLSILTLPAAGFGIWLGRQIGLGTPLIDALLTNQSGSHQKLLRDFCLATLLGLTLGGLLLLVRMISEPYLPTELPSFGHRGVIGGFSVSLGAAVAEEVWFRLGLMTLLVWCANYVTGNREPRSIIIWAIIVITAVGFGVAHLPQLMSYGADSPFAIGGTIIGNCIVGILYGWCYWRRSLIAAIVAHLSVDLVLHVFPAFVG